MDIDALVKNLHPLEIKVLLNFSPEQDLDNDLLMSKLAFKAGQCNQAFSWLEAKDLLEKKSSRVHNVYELTELGVDYKANGCPEERIIKALEENGPLKMPQLAENTGLQNKDVGSAYGQMAKDGLLSMGEGKTVQIKERNNDDRIKHLRAILDKAEVGSFLEESVLSADEIKVMEGISKKRGASSAPFKAAEREEIIYALKAESRALKTALQEKGISGEEIGALTPELLSSGKWKKGSFREYNVNIPPARTLLGRRNPYAEYLTQVKDKLVSLGFEEFDGPLVETEFWNSDSLFMPQFHAARDIHDAYYVKKPTHAKEIKQPYLDRIASTHENGWETGSRGWEYNFSRDFTRRLLLRSQGTVLSAKQLHQAKVPGKYFGIARCFRYDQVDATHGADFYQTEGIVLSESANLKTLLGLLKMFAEELAGAKEIKYVPAYFPFTEPSVEVHIKHPRLGWMELGGSGIFRPEVTKPMGIDVPVLAWGMGIDRMALMHLGLNDLRELFSHNIENVRLRRRQ